MKSTLGPKGMVCRTFDLTQSFVLVWVNKLLILFDVILFSSQDKILQSMGRGDSIQVTNDGATILKAIGVDNPAAKVLVGKSGQYTPQTQC